MLDDAKKEGYLAPANNNATGVKAKSPRKNKNVGIPHEFFELVEWAAGEESTLAFIIY